MTVLTYDKAELIARIEKKKLEQKKAFDIANEAERIKAISQLEAAMVQMKVVLADLKVRKKVDERRGYLYWPNWDPKAEFNSYRYDHAIDRLKLAQGDTLRLNDRELDSILQLT